MRLTIRMLGLTLLDIELTEADEVDVEYDGSGTTATTPLGFTANYPMPDDVGLPSRWGEDET